MTIVLKIIIEGNEIGQFSKKLGLVSFEVSFIKNFNGGSSDIQG